MEKYIPLDKSWMIRLGVLDLIEGKSDTLRYLEKQEALGDDLVALKRVLGEWNEKEKIDVGESGTLYRLLQFVSWKFDLNKKFVKQGTLKDRRMYAKPDMVNWSQSDLLRLDGGTSQWASAAVLCGDKERLGNAPEKLKLSYEVMDSGDKEPRKDKTILGQAETFVNRTMFEPKHSEDYCFARAFQMITKEEGEKRWPSLREHESDRIEEMEKALDEFDRGLPISSKDHRVVQSIAMLGKVAGKSLEFENPSCVSKSWPLFWDFLKK